MNATACNANRLGRTQMSMTEEHNVKNKLLVERRPPRILVAEDDLEMRRFLVTALRMDGYSVTEAANGDDVLSYVGPYLHAGMEFCFDLIISDIRMPGIDGLDILAGLGMCDQAPPVVLITAFGDARTHADAERLGAVMLLDKPFDVDELRAVLRRCLSHRRE